MIGWFANDANTLSRVGQVLLNAEDEVAAVSTSWKQVLVATDAFELADASVAAALADAPEKLAALLGNIPVKNVKLAQSSDTTLPNLMNTFRILQGMFRKNVPSKRLINV